MQLRLSRPPPPPPTFKFLDPNGDLHKLHLPTPPTLSALHSLITPHFPHPFKLKYIDPEGDPILLTSNHHLSVCLQDALLSNTSLRLHITPLPTPSPASSPSPSSSPPSTPSAASTTSTDSTPSNSTPPPSPSLPPTTTLSRQHRRAFKSNLRVFNRALALDRANLRALQGRADVYLAASQWDNARADFQQVLHMLNRRDVAVAGGELAEKEVGQVRRGLVLALVGGRRYEEAVAEGVALEEDGEGEREREGEEGGGWFVGVLKERLDVVTGEAVGLLEGGKFTAAVDVYTDALALEEVYVKVGGGRRRRSLRIGRAMANEALERVGLALEDYRDVVGMGGGMVGWLGCGRCLLEVGEVGEAYEMYRRALGEDPTCREAVERMGVIKEFRQELGGGLAGEKGRAVEWWQQAGNKAEV